MTEQRANVYDINEYRQLPAGEGAADLRDNDQLDLRKSRLMSPEAARALLLTHQAYAETGVEKPLALIVAEYALACGVNIGQVRSDKLDSQESKAA